MPIVWGDPEVEGESSESNFFRRVCGADMTSMVVDPHWRFSAQSNATANPRTGMQTKTARFGNDKQSIVNFMCVAASGGTVARQPREVITT